MDFRNKMLTLLMGCSVNMSWIRCGNGIYVPLVCEIPQLPGEVRTADLTLLNEQQYIMFSWPLVVIHTVVWTGSTGLKIHSITSLSNTYLQHLTVYFIYGFSVQHWDTRLIRQADRVIPLCVCVCVYSCNGRANRENLLQFPWKLQTSFNDGRHRKRALKETVIR